MKYNKAVKTTIATIAVASLLRIYQKLFLISPESGFFTGSDITIYLFFIIIGIGTALLISFYRNSIFTKLEKQRSGLLGVVSFLLSAIILWDTYTWATYSSPIPPLVPVPSWIGILLEMTGYMSVLVMVALGLHFMTKRDISGVLISSAVLPLWMSVRSITRFGYFTQVTTVSDNLIESCFMMLSCLFLISHAYTLTHHNKKSFRAIINGLSTAMFGIPLVVGQLAVALTAGANIGPTLQNLSLVLCISVYALLYTNFILKCELTEGENE